MQKVLHPNFLYTMYRHQNACSFFFIIEGKKWPYYGKVENNSCESLAFNFFTHRVQTAFDEAEIAEPCKMRPNIMISFFLHRKPA